MLAFRKLFLALALVTLTMAVASAQQVPAFQCVANAGVPPIVRAEGIAELVGDVVLNCNNGTPTATGLAIPQVNVQVFLNTNITSKIDGDNFSEALLMIDEPTPTEQKVCRAGSASGGNCGNVGYTPNPGLVYKQHVVGESTITPFNVFQGRKAASENSIVWLGVPVDAPGTTTTRIIRITNVRANANMLGTSSTLVPTQIVMFVSVTGSTSVPVNNPQQTVAFIQNGLSFSVRKLNGDSGSASLKQCASNASDTFADASKTDKYCYTGRLRFDEGFATAWKTRFAVSGPGPGYTTADYQNFPGVIYNVSESGFWSAGVSNWPIELGEPAGMAKQGTRLRVVFNNFPTDGSIRLFVSLNNAGFTSVNNARLVTVSADGSGGYVETAGSGGTVDDSVTGSCKDWLAVTRTLNGGSASEGTYQNPFAEVPLFGGTGIAVWEVINTDPLAIQRMEFGYLVAYKSDTANNKPPVITATANGMFAPISTITTMSSSAPVPRFADTSSARTLFSIAQCVSNILFPFVTNQAGFNTGLVISNTTKDPYGTANQSGTCTLNYYGDTNGGAAPPAQTSGVVPAGDYLAFDLMTGGKFGVTATPGFQGYVIAVCRFQMAHGYAFISDVNLARVANGYLALILDEHNTEIRLSNTGETLGN